MDAPRRAMGALTNAALLMIGPSCGTESETPPTGRDDIAALVRCLPDGIGRIRCTSTTDMVLSLDLPHETVDRGISPGSPVTARFLPPDHPIAWLATAGPITRSGNVSTSPLPSSVDLHVAIEGTLGQRYLLLPMGCGRLPEAWLTILDTRVGRVVWAENPASLAGLPRTSLVGITVHPDGSLWTITGRDAIIGVDLEGHVLQAWTHPKDLVYPVHHDLAWEGDTLLALDASVHPVDERDYVLDGVTALSPSGIDRPWELAHHVTPSGTPSASGAYWSELFGTSAVDWSHANGITPDEDGWLISLRHLDAVLRIDRSTGQIDWVLSADDSPLAPGLEWVVPGDVAPGLRGPHHPTRMANGRLLVLDNGIDRDSRVLAIEIDPEAGLAIVHEVYDLDQTCPFQGGAYEQSDGTILATCATERTITAFHARGTVRGTAHVTCNNGRIGDPLLRAIPLSEPAVVLPAL